MPRKLSEASQAPNIQKKTFLEIFFYLFLIYFLVSVETVETAFSLISEREKIRKEMMMMMKTLCVSEHLGVGVSVCVCVCVWVGVGVSDASVRVGVCMGECLFV